MNFLYAIILGAIEGITEYLPISSTGHLILTTRVLNLEITEFLKSFEIAIQLGAILAVAVLYWRQLFTRWKIIKKIIVAFIPTGIIGLLFYKIVKTYLIGNSAVVLCGLLLGGVFLIGFELWYRKKENKSLPPAGYSLYEREKNPSASGHSLYEREKNPSASGHSLYERENNTDLQNISYAKAAILGVFQSIAIIPGVSRSAATIIGGLLMGISRRAVVEFSFLLAVPTMLAATGLDLIKNAGQFSLAQWDFLAAGFIISFIVAIIAIKFLLNFIKNHSFISFGVYRIAAALLFWWWL